MKTRQGFVSNSSTSSFFIVVSEKLHQKTLETFTEDEKKYLNAIMAKRVFDGNEVRIYSSITGMGGETYPSHDEDCPEGVDSHETFYDYKEKVKLDKNNVICCSHDC